MKMLSPVLYLRLRPEATADTIGELLVSSFVGNVGNMWGKCVYIQVFLLCCISCV